MKNDNSSRNDNENTGDDSTIGDSADQEVESSEYEGDESDDSGISSSASESSTTENPVVTENDDDGYIQTLIGVDPALPVPPNDDDFIYYMKYVIWQQHQAAMARAAPYMHVQPANVGHGLITVVANAEMMPPGTLLFPAAPPASGTGTFSGVPPAGMMPVTGNLPAVPPPGTGTLFGEPPAGNLSSVPPAAARGNGGNVPIPQPSTAVPPESSSAVPPENDGVVPTEGDNGKA